VPSAVVRNETERDMEDTKRMIGPWRPVVIVSL
jgi:hypothetical protein